MDLSKEIMNLVGGKKRTKKPKIYDSEDEDGEVDIGDIETAQASPSKISPSDLSTHSSAQDSLSSSTSSDEFDENFMGDNDDRSFLASLTEVEREAVLFERSEARRLKLERKELKRKLMQREGKIKSVKQPTKKQKKSRYDYEDEEFSSVSELSDESVYEEEEEKLLDFEGKKPVKAASSPAFINDMTYEQALQLTLSRNHIEKLLGRIFFEEAVVDAFVRISSGIREGGVPVYRFAQIHSVTEYNKVYRVNELDTKKAFVLIYGKSKRTFRMDLVSNSPINQAEFERWKWEMSQCSLSLPTQHQAQDKIDQITKFDNQAVTDSEINAMIEEKKKMGKTFARNFASEKIGLLRMRDAAEEAGDQSECDRLNDEIAALDVESEKLFPGSNQTQILPQSIRAKKNQLIQSRIYSSKRFATTGGMTDTLDPFARRRCLPTIIHLEGNNSIHKDESLESFPMESTENSESVSNISIDSLVFPLQPIDYYSLHSFSVEGLDKNSLGFDESSFESYLSAIPRTEILASTSLSTFNQYNSQFNYW